MALPLPASADPCPCSQCRDRLRRRASAGRTAEVIAAVLTSFTLHRSPTPQPRAHLQLHPLHHWNRATHREASPSIRAARQQPLHVDYVCRRTSPHERATVRAARHIGTLPWRLALTSARRRRGIVAWFSLIVGRRSTRWRTIWPSAAPVGLPTLSTSARSGEIATRTTHRAAAERARRGSARPSPTDEICASTTGDVQSVVDNRKTCLYATVAP